MPTFFFQFDVRPEPTHRKCSEYSGAMVNCWIKGDTQSQAEAVARVWADKDWRIVSIERASLITRETQRPAGMWYFEQAEIDGEVFVFSLRP